MKKEILLASASPRRKDILELLHIPYEVMPSDVDESQIDIENPIELVETLARLKAEAVRDKAHNNHIILGSDTVVVNDNTILGKPKNELDVHRFLNRLSNKSHKVITAIALIDIEQKRTIVNHSVTEVSFRQLTEIDIVNYIESGEPFDKAGAYAIQGLGASFVNWISGDYYSVVGLPVSCLMTMISELGYDYNKDLYKKY